MGQRGIAGLMVGHMAGHFGRSCDNMSCIIVMDRAILIGYGTYTYRRVLSFRHYATEYVN